MMKMFKLDTLISHVLFSPRSTFLSLGVCPGHSLMSEWAPWHLLSGNS